MFCVCVPGIIVPGIRKPSASQMSTRSRRRGFVRALGKGQSIFSLHSLFYSLILIALALKEH